MREPVDLTQYQGGLKGKKKNALIREKYPEAEIHTLVANENLKKGEKIIDNALFLLTDAPPGAIGMAKSIDNIDNGFYLVEENDEQHLVLITSDFIDSQKLEDKVVAKVFRKFDMGNYRFTVGGKLK